MKVFSLSPPSRPATIKDKALLSTPAGLDKMMKALSDAPKKVRAGLQGRFAKDGEALVAKMRAAAPVGTGALRESIKSMPSKSGVGVRITAGGPTTTSRSAHGKPYDHALATEFGTRKEKARPFFFPTLRAAKADLRKGARDTAQKALKG